MSICGNYGTNKFENTELETKKGDEWTGFETYENSLNVDRIFESFNIRVGYESAQCVR